VCVYAMLKMSHGMHVYMFLIIPELLHRSMIWEMWLCPL